MPIDPQSVLRRHKRLVEQHQLWRWVWQDIANVIHPRRAQFVLKPAPGQRQTEHLYDSTALDANDRLASTLNGTLTTRSAKWFSLKIRDEQLNESQDVQEWLEECAKRMFRVFNQSNFNSEVHEVYLDEGAFGTAALLEEEKEPESSTFKGIIFRALALADLVIDENAEGRVDTLMRTFKMSAAAAVDKWGRDKLGPRVLQAFDTGKADDLFEFLHAVFPRKIDGKPIPTQGTPKTNLPVASVYIGMLDKNLIDEGGFNEFPFMVPRWTKTAGEIYGRGPGHIALPDTKTLNKVVELGLRTWAKNLDMPTKSIDDGVVGPIRNVPGGNTIVRDMEALQPLFPPGTFRESISNDQVKAGDLKASIRRIFFADQMELPQGPQMTAFEVAKRFELLERLLGPTMGRQETELLNPLIERTFGIMFRKGAFTPPPDILTKNGADIDVQYEGPLAKSQRLSEVEGIERLGQYVQGAATLQPNVIDVIDFDQAVRISADVLGVPTHVLRDPKDVAKMRAQRDQQNAERQQLMDAQTTAQAAGKAAPALKLLPQVASAQGGNNGQAA
jgi:hypothetical protein